ETQDSRYRISARSQRRLPPVNGRRSAGPFLSFQLNRIRRYIVAEFKLGTIGPLLAKFGPDRDAQFLELADLLDQVATPAHQLAAGLLVSVGSLLRTAADGVHAAEESAQRVVAPTCPLREFGRMAVLVLEAP